MKQPMGDSSADVEALFRDVRVLNDTVSFTPRSITTEYVRMKIFTDRGKKKYAEVEVPFWGKSRIFDVEGRTIHPDGSVIDMKKDAIFEKVLAKRRHGEPVKVISFALPSVEPGSIIEYKWKKDAGESIGRYIPLEVQSEFPVDEVTFHIKPLTSAYVHVPELRVFPFRCVTGKIEKETNGFSYFTLRNVPAFDREPDMPPELSVKQWILVFYEENGNIGKDKFWTSLAREHYKGYEDKIKVNGDAKEIAAQIVAGAGSDDDKIARIFDYCHKTLKDVRGSEITTEERERAKENGTTADTLKRKSGTPEDIRLAFVALVSAAGYKARIAELANRSTFLFDQSFQSAYFLDTELVAVNLNGAWRFYDVNTDALAAGQLRWQHQGVSALIDDSKEPEFVKTPILSAKQTQVQKLATLTLSEDGTLEGDVREILTGNKAMAWREEWAHANEAEREDALHEQMKQRFAQFELTNVKYTSLPDANKPVGWSYHIVVPGYAQRTGKRIFITPNFFSAGLAARFPSTERHQPIYFEYPWSESVMITLNLPAGFELDHPDFPGGYNFPPMGSYILHITGGKQQISYNRLFTFGGEDFLALTADSYPALKTVFDKAHESDNKVLTLKASGQAGPGQPSQTN